MRIRKEVDEKLHLFSKNPHDLGLRNHAVQKEWEGFRSIDVTNDYRAIYKKCMREKKYMPILSRLGLTMNSTASAA